MCLYYGKKNPNEGGWDLHKGHEFISYNHFPSVFYVIYNKEVKIQQPMILRHLLN